MTDLIPNDLSHLSDEEFMALCPQGEHTPGREPLSPAAQAVLDALYMDELNGPQQLMACAHAAAALRAVADQVAPDDYDPPREGSYPEAASFVDGKCVRNEDIRYQLLAIAAELEGSND